MNLMIYWHVFLVFFLHLWDYELVSSMRAGALPYLSLSFHGLSPVPAYFTIDF